MYNYVVVVIAFLQSIYNRLVYKEKGKKYILFLVLPIILWIYVFSRVVSFFYRDSVLDVYKISSFVLGIVILVMVFDAIYRGIKKSKDSNVLLRVLPLSKGTNRWLKGSKFYLIGLFYELVCFVPFILVSYDEGYNISGELGILIFLVVILMPFIYMLLIVGIKFLKEVCRRSLYIKVLVICSLVIFYIGFMYFVLVSSDWLLDNWLISYFESLFRGSIGSLVSFGCISIGSLMGVIFGLDIEDDVRDKKEYMLDRKVSYGSGFNGNELIRIRRNGQRIIGSFIWLVILLMVLGYVLISAVDRGVFVANYRDIVPLFMCLVIGVFNLKIGCLIEDSEYVDYYKVMPIRMRDVLHGKMFRRYIFNVIIGGMLVLGLGIVWNMNVSWFVSGGLLVVLGFAFLDLICLLFELLLLKFKDYKGMALNLSNFLYKFSVVVMFGGLFFLTEMIGSYLYWEYFWMLLLGVGNVILLYVIRMLIND